MSWTKTLPKESLLKCVLSRHLMSKTFGVYRLFLWVQVSFVRLGLIYMECSVRSAWSFLLYVSNSFTIMVFDVESMLNFQVLHSPKYILRQCNAETSLRTRFTSLEMWWLLNEEDKRGSVGRVLSSCFGVEILFTCNSWITQNTHYLIP